jgi:hypothetical protein
MTGKLPYDTRDGIGHTALAFAMHEWLAVIAADPGMIIVGKWPPIWDAR